MQPVMSGVLRYAWHENLPKGDYFVCCHINNPVSLWGVDDVVRLYIIKEHMNYRIKNHKKRKKEVVNRNTKKIIHEKVS